MCLPLPFFLALLKPLHGIQDLNAAETFDALSKEAVQIDEFTAAAIQERPLYKKRCGPYEEQPQFSPIGSQRARLYH